MKEMDKNNTGYNNELLMSIKTIDKCDDDKFHK